MMAIGPLRFGNTGKYGFGGLGCHEVVLRHPGTRNFGYEAGILQMEGATGSQRRVLHLSHVGYFQAFGVPTGIKHVPLHNIRGSSVYGNFNIPASSSCVNETNITNILVHSFLFFGYLGGITSTMSIFRL